MFSDTQPAALHASGGQDPWADFRVDHPTEILTILRQVRDASVPVNLSAPDGNSLRSSLWSIVPEQRRLNFSADSLGPQLQPMIDGNEIVAVSYLESVKLQFDLRGLVLVRGSHGSTLQADFPDEIYRFQRRRAYRVRTIERNSPTVHLRHPANPDQTLALRVTDVSIGGCALLAPPEVSGLNPGSRIQGARVELDADTRFDANLQFQHVSTMQGGEHGARIGCEWLQLSGAAERVLQLYIDQTQKRRRMLSLE